MTMGGPTISAWQRRTPDPYEADVVIVGAGISGLGAAYWLTQRDPALRVVVLDRGRPGAGASGRNAGFLTAGSVAHHARQRARHGDATAMALWALARENHRELHRAFLHDDGRAYARDAALSIAHDPDSFGELEQAAAHLREGGVEVEALDDAAIFERAGFRAPAERVARGWSVRDEGRVDPVALVERMAAACGATIFGGVDVHAVVTEPDGVTLETSAMAFRAPRVVLATNAWTPALCPELAEVLSPVRGQCLLTAPTRRPVRGQVYGTDDWLYLRPHPGGGVVVGGLRPLDADVEVGVEDRLNPKIQPALDAILERSFGALFDEGRVDVVRRWSGAMAYAHRGIPLVGPVPRRPGLFMLGGYSGHGMGLGFVCARALADLLVSGERPAWLDAP